MHEIKWNIKGKICCVQKWTKEKWENRLVTKYKTNFILRIPADTPARLSPMTLWIDYSYWMTALLWLPWIIDIQILNSHLLTVQLVSLLGEVSRFFSRVVLLFIAAKETLDSKYVCPLKNVLILLILLMIGEVTDLWNIWPFINSRLWPGNNISSFSWFL